MSDMKPIGWVIVTPKGKVLRHTVSSRRDPQGWCYSAWDSYADSDNIDNRIESGMVPDIIREAKRLGYRAERVYVKGGN